MNDTLKDYVSTFTGTKKTELKPLAISGSSREYFRFEKEGTSYILCKNEDISENETFFYYTETFKNLSANVPTIYSVSKDKQYYILQDLGNLSLLDLRLSDPKKANTFYTESLKKLAHLQIGADQILDYNKAYDFKSFSKILALRDLFYFKDYFLDFQSVPYKQSDFLQECESLAIKMVESKFRYFMYRDFQGRNLLIHDEKPFFIDYQGGIKGPIMYDVASLLWQAKAQLSSTEKEELLQGYFKVVENLIPTQFNQTLLRKDYSYCTLIRLLQVLGAYGKLGIIENKPHFKQSIEFGIQNLAEYISDFDLSEFPTIHHICKQLIQKEIEF